MGYHEFIIRILFCFMFSLTIGIERQWRRRTLGLRTNVLVCIGSFLFVCFSIQTNANDISRIAAQVVSGIGFLGAGVIIKDGTNIRGLNTAATLWCNASIGVLCAAGLIVEAGIGTLFILFTNIVIRYAALKMSKEKNIEEEFVFKVTCDEDKELLVKNIIGKATKGSDVLLTSIDKNYLEGRKIKLYANIKTKTNFTTIIDKIMDRIIDQPGVDSVGWEKIEKMTHEQLDDD